MSDYSRCLCGEKGKMCENSQVCQLDNDDGSCTWTDCVAYPNKTEMAVRGCQCGNEVCLHHGKVCYKLANGDGKCDRPSPGNKLMNNWVRSGKTDILLLDLPCRRVPRFPRSFRPRCVPVWY